MSSGRTGPGASVRFAFHVAMTIAGSGLLSSPARVAAQSPMSAGLARVLAETADGFRDGQPHWIVANPRYPYRVSGVFPSEAAARASLAPGGVDLVFGPWVTLPGLNPPGFVLPDPLPQPDVWLRCKHMLLPIPSIMDPYCPSQGIPIRDIREMTLLIRTASDTFRVNLMEGGIADAVFLTASSIDKFVLPYYARVYGPAFAAAMGDSIRARASRLRP